MHYRRRSVSELYPVKDIVFILIVVAIALTAAVFLSHLMTSV